MKNMSNKAKANILSLSILTGAFFLIIYFAINYLFPSQLEDNEVRQYNFNLKNGAKIFFYTRQWGISGESRSVFLSKSPLSEDADYKNMSALSSGPKKYIILNTDSALYLYSDDFNMDEEVLGRFSGLIETKLLIKDEMEEFLTEIKNDDKYIFIK